MRTCAAASRESGRRAPKPSSSSPRCSNPARWPAREPYTHRHGARKKGAMHTRTAAATGAAAACAAEAATAAAGAAAEAAASALVRTPRHVQLAATSLGAGARRAHLHSDRRESHGARTRECVSACAAHAPRAPPRAPSLRAAGRHRDRQPPPPRAARPPRAPPHPRPHRHRRPRGTRCRGTTGSPRRSARRAHPPQAACPRVRHRRAEDHPPPRAPRPRQGRPRAAAAAPRRQAHRSAAHR